MRVTASLLPGNGGTIGAPATRRRAVGGRGRSSGFTVIELLIVIALVAGTAVLASPFLSDALQKEDLGAAAEGAVDALRLAQSVAMTGKGTGHAGVHFESGMYSYFEGASYVPGDPSNEPHGLSGLVTISAIALNGGGSDVTFGDRRGTPDQTGTVTFTDAGGASVAVTIGEAGVIRAD